jgi:cytoskeletal protein RodZ
MLFQAATQPEVGHTLLLLFNIFIIGGVGALIWVVAAARANDKKEREEDRKKQDAVLITTEANKKVLETIQTNHLAHLAESMERTAKGIEKLTEVTTAGNQDLAVIRYELTRPKTQV